MSSDAESEGAPNPDWEEQRKLYLEKIADAAIRYITESEKCYRKWDHECYVGKIDVDVLRAALVNRTSWAEMPLNQLEQIMMLYHHLDSHQDLGEMDYDDRITSHGAAITIWGSALKRRDIHKLDALVYRRRVEAGLIKDESFDKVWTNRISELKGIRLCAVTEDKRDVLNKIEVSDITKDTSFYCYFVGTRIGMRIYRRDNEFSPSLFLTSRDECKFVNDLQLNCVGYYYHEHKQFYGSNAIINEIIRVHDIILKET